MDWLLLLPCIGLSLLSLCLLLGIYRTRYIPQPKLNMRSIMIQGIATGLGAVFAVILANINYRALADKWKIYVPAAYLFMLSTFVFGVGTSVSPEDKRWLIIPGINMSVQPSEFLKLAFILSFAYHVYKTQDRFNHPLHIFLLCLHALIPVALVQIQGDSGTALMFLLIFLSMMFVAGIKWIYIAVALVAVPAILPVVWAFLLSDAQRNRFLALLGQSASDAAYYQQYQAALAVASGKLTGAGLFSPSIVYVPEMHNDFIFAFVANATGFLGCAAVFLVIALIGGKMLLNTGYANDKQGQLICAGVFAMFFGQSVINICMCLSLLPVIGNSLPFLSSGGSFVLTNYMGIGLVMSVYKHTKRKPKVESFLPKGEQPVI
jgi:rod shape determining protein RodA